MDLANKRQTVLMAALAVIVAVVLIAVFLPEDAIEAPSLNGRPAHGANQMDVGGRAASGDAATPRVVFKAGSAATQSREPLPPSGIALSGRVIDKVSREPVKAFDFHLIKIDREANTSVDLIRETVRDDEGRFSFGLEQGGRHSLFVTSSRHREARLIGLEVADETGLTGLEIELDPGASISGRVVEDATGRPVKDALVVAGLDTRAAAMIVLAGREEAGPHAWTDGEGRFALGGLRDAGELLAQGIPMRELGIPALLAFHPEYATGTVTGAPRPDGSVEIRVEPGYRVYGQARDDDGEPVQGVLITAQSARTPCLPVLTGPDGSYRTRPIRPGRVDVHAGPPWFGEKDLPGFHAESKVANIVDCDVEIDFGSEPYHVAWRGTFYDREQPVGGGVVTVRADPTYPGAGERPWAARKVTSDEAGRFELGRLLPGRYDVQLEFPNRGGSCPWGEITFEGPGVVEKDIRLSGSTISGIVIDGATGAPLENANGRVHGAHDELKYSLSSWISAEGRFALRSVPPGRCTLDAEIMDRPKSPVVPVDVLAGRDVSDVRIVVPAGGTLIVRLAGFGGGSPGSPHYVHVWLRPDGGDEPGRALPIGVEDGGSAEGSFSLLPGAWSADFDYQGAWRAQREFEIKMGLETIVELQRGELQPLNTLILAGTLTRGVGAPVPGAKIAFRSLTTTAAAALVVVTDAGGAFRLEGVRPGAKQVHVDLGDDRRVELPNLVIPYDASGEFRCDAVLPSGVVTGALRDGGSGLYLSADGPRWHVFLSDAEGRNTLTWQRNAAGPRFTLDAVAPGEYRLRILAAGYMTHVQAPLTVSEGQVLDLGDIVLQPCGLLGLEVVDEDGRFLSRVSVHVKGVEQNFHPTEHLASGAVRYGELPLGKVTLRIGAPGFKSKETTVFLEPAKPIPCRVVLERE